FVLVCRSGGDLRLTLRSRFLVDCLRLFFVHGLWLFDFLFLGFFLGRILHFGILLCRFRGRMRRGRRRRLGRGLFLCIFRFDIGELPLRRRLGLSRVHGERRLGRLFLGNTSGLSFSSGFLFGRSPERVLLFLFAGSTPSHPLTLLGAILIRVGP